MVMVLDEIEKGLCNLFSNFDKIQHRKWYCFPNKIKRKSFREPKSRKYLWENENPQVEEKFLDWFIRQRSKHIAVSAEIIKQKAKMINDKIGQQQFNTSIGWFVKFKTRLEDVGRENLCICRRKKTCLVERYQNSG